MNQLLARRRRLMSMAQPEDPYLTQPFTMVFQVNRSITLSGANDSNYTALTSLKYNKNNTGWVNVDLSSSRTLSFSTGDSVQWIGNGAWRVDDSGNGFRISGSFLSAVGNKGICSLEGNLLSLFGGDNFTSMTSIPDYALYGGLELITDEVVGNYSYFVGDITNLRIPATTIGNYSLYCVFYMECMRQGDATNLFPNLTTVGNYGLYMAFGVDSNPYAFSNEFKPPILKATTLGEGAYDCMFHYSKSMTTTPPTLPATTLANYCYRRMFFGCTSITTAPSLPATTLTKGCYDRMFQGCTALVTAPSLPATTLADYCYRNMFYGCTKLTTAPTTLPATTLADYCYQRMFYNCTKLTTAPTTLPATTLAYACYDSMYYNTNFLPDTTNIDFTSQSAVQNGYLIGLFAGTKITDSQLRNILPLSNGRACLPVTVLSNKCYQNMFSGCTALTTAPDLPATTLAANCYDKMFYGCTKLTTPPTLPATTLVTQCYNYMFYNCKALTTAPELPATTLVSHCYRYMFQGCSNLNYIKAMFTTTPGTGYTQSWVSSVASSGTFVKNSAATWSVSGVNGVPNNWTIQTASS